MDKRIIYFNYFEPDLSQHDRISKSLGKISDSLLFSKIRIIIGSQTLKSDTVNCLYVNNEILFNKIDTVNLKNKNLFLNFEIFIEKKKRRVMLNLPFTYFFLNSDEKSKISISVEKKPKGLFHLVLSKVDYPFITSSIDIKPNRM